MSSVKSLTLAPGVIVTSPQDDPMVARRSEVTREMLREGIRQLTALERDTLRLATRERLGVDEVAAQLQIDVLQIESSLRSGLLSLRQSLLAQLGDE